MNNSGAWPEAAELVVLVLLPSALVLAAMMPTHKSKQHFAFRLLLGIAALGNWALFLAFVLTDGFSPFHIRIAEFAPALLLLTLVLIAVSRKVQARRWMLETSNVIVLALWFTFAYSPQHWFARGWLGSARIGDRTIPVVVYVAEPRDSEAASIALVRVRDVGNYFVDLGDETFREASSSELLPLHYGVWTWRAAPNGSFQPPLPYLRVNECRIRLGDGRVLSIDF